MKKGLKFLFKSPINVTTVYDGGKKMELLYSDDDDNSSSISIILKGIANTICAIFQHIVGLFELMLYMIAMVISILIVALLIPIFVISLPIKAVYNFFKWIFK